MTIKNKIYQNFKATIIKFLQLNVFLRRTILIFCTWVILVYVLKINLNNYWLKTLYEFLQIKYFLSLSIDKLIFAICFSCSILFLTNKLKLYYKTKYSKTRNQLDFEIRKCMQTIWFYQANMYFYVFLYLIIFQIINHLFFENKFILFNTGLIILFFVFYIYKLLNLKYYQFELIYCNFNNIKYVSNKFNNESIIKIIIVNTKTSLIEYIASSRLGKSLGSKLGGKVLTPDLHAEIKEISSKLHNTSKKVSEMEKFLELEKTRQVVEYSRRAFYQDVMLGLGTAATITGSVVAYNSYQVGLENERLKKRITDLTEESLRQHDKYLALQKSSSQNSNISRESIQSSLDQDIENIIQQCNGIPINGNSSLYNKRI